MEIIKRDGSQEEVRLEKILHAVGRSCEGLSGVEPLEIAKRTINGLHQGSTTKELDNLSISHAVMLMAEEPNYSRVAARMLAESIRKEVGRGVTFEDYISQADTLELLHPKTAKLAKENLEAIQQAIDHKRDGNFEYFGMKTIADRYLLRHPYTRLLIERPQYLFMRVALGLSQTVEEAIRFYHVISQFDYCPATPTLFNSGTMHPQMSSCYLLKVEEDSLEGIYRSVMDCAKLSKFSGGIGIDWTPVRASGARIKGTNGLSNGIIPFLKLFDSSVHAVNQGGKRKGAAAVYLEPWHADIEAFLELRNNTGAEERRTHNLNLALWIPDLFMKRVENNGNWSLFSPDEVPELLNHYGARFEAAYEAYEQVGKARRVVSARELFARMMQTLAETGNGWLCFKDHCNERSAQTLRPENQIRSSNLCTEILEVASERETAVCNLGSLNLARFVTPNGSFDFDRLGETVRTVIPYLDRVVDINFYPTEKAATSNQRWRPVGLGVMGLQDTFFLMRLPLESPEAQKLSARIAETIYFHALQASMELASKEGAFPAFQDSRYIEGKLQVQLSAAWGHQIQPHYDWDALAKEVAAKGVRNSLLIAIAPTATIASIVGSFESIEPQISNFFKRETLSGEFLQVNRYLIKDLQRLGLWNHLMRSKIIEHEGSIQDIEEIPSNIRQLYKTTWEISQKILIDMAAARGHFICQAQSLNLFIENPSVGKLSSMYMYAWKNGIKTTYYLRSRARTSIKKTTTVQTEDVTCSLENPEQCEACQ
jgi:ribonucleoside-diphosphate reductase alpha chain